MLPFSSNIFGWISLKPVCCSLNLDSSTMSYLSVDGHILIIKLEVMCILRFKSIQVDFAGIILGLLCLWMRFKKEWMKCSKDSQSNVESCEEVQDRREKFSISPSLLLQLSALLIGILVFPHQEWYAPLQDECRTFPSHHIQLWIKLKERM